MNRRNGRKVHEDDALRLRRRLYGNATVKIDLPIYRIVSGCVGADRISDILFVFKKTVSPNRSKSIPLRNITLVIYRSFLRLLFCSMRSGKTRSYGLTESCSNPYIRPKSRTRGEKTGGKPAELQLSQAALACSNS